MEIDISVLNQGMEKEIYLDQDIDIDFSHEEVKSINGLHLKGSISLNDIGEFELDLELTGNMLLVDSISLNDVNYPFVSEIKDKVEKNDGNFNNLLDLSEILWQNIVLEIPLRFTEVNDLTEFKCDGWKLLSEEDVKKGNNPFEELKTMFGEE